MGLFLRFEASAPEDRTPLRQYAIALCEREGATPLPLPDGGLLLRLHPAGDPLPLVFEGGTVRGSVNTLVGGPGYHRLLCRLLHDLEARFLPDLAVTDDTGFFDDGAGPFLELRHREAWLEAGEAALEALHADHFPLFFLLPRGLRVPLRHPRRLATALETFTATRFRALLDAVRDGADLAPHVPWWCESKDAAYWRHVALAHARLRREGVERAPRQALERALDAGARAQALDPEGPTPALELARAAEALDRLEDAIPWAERAAAAEPRHLDLHAWLADLYERAGRRDDAAAALARLAERLPHTASVAYEAGLRLNAAGRHTEALPLLERACGLRPKTAWHHGERAVALAGLGRLDEALTAMRRALELEPENAGGWRSAAELLRALGRASEAEEADARAEALAQEAAEQALAIEDEAGREAAGNG